MNRRRQLFLPFSLVIITLSGCGLSAKPEAKNNQSVISTTSSSIPPVPIVKSIDAKIQGQPYGKGLSAVRFVSATTGYMDGNGIILKTTDGGQIFSAVAHTSVNLTGLSITKTAATTVAAWGGHSIMVSHNGGSNWSTTTLPQNIIQAEFATASEGFAITQGNRAAATSLASALWRTTDGGVHWVQLQTPSPPVSVSFGSAGVGWVGVVGGDIFQTVNSGQTWNRVLHLGANLGEARVYAVSSQICWALITGGSGMSQTSYSVFRTTNGTNWTAVLGVSTAGAGPAPGNPTNVPKGPGSSPGPMAVLGPGEAVIAGVCEACGWGTASLSSTQDGGASWSSHPAISNSEGPPASMSFVSLNEGWVLDNRGDSGNGVLLHTLDGGSSWKEVYPTTHPHPTIGISFVNQDIGFGIGVPGNANAVVRSSNGGLTWTQVGVLPATKVTSYANLGSPIDFLTSQHGYIVGQDGKLFETKDGGRTWTLQQLPKASKPFASVMFVSGGVYGTVNTFGRQIDVTQDGGQSWHAIQLPSHSYVEAGAEIYLAKLIHLPSLLSLTKLVQSQRTGWAGFRGTQLAWMPNTDSSGFQLTRDGGANWTDIQIGPSDSIYALDFSNYKDGWMITGSGSLLRTTNGGRTWTYASHPNP